MTSNGDVRKSLHLRLSKSSLAGRANNNAEDMWSKTDVDVETCYTGSKLSIPGGALRARRELIRPMSRKDIFYSGSVTNLPEYQSQKSLAGYRQSVLSLSMYGQGGTGAVDEKPPPDLCPCLALPDSMRHALASMMDVSLLKDPVFMMIAISNVFGMAGLYVPFVYLVDVAKQRNVDEHNASMLLSWIGIVNTVGRVLCGYVADFPQVNTLLMNNICLIMATLSVAAVPFCETYFSFILVAIFFGISISGYISLTSIILVDLLGLDKLTNAFGLLILFRGVAATVGSPLAGVVYDATGGYDIPFFMAAGLFAISTVTSFLAGPIKQWTASEELPPQLDALTPIDEDDEEEEEEEEEQEGIQITIPEIRETAPSPRTPNPPKEIKQIESVL